MNKRIECGTLSRHDETSVAPKLSIGMGCVQI